MSHQDVLLIAGAIVAGAVIAALLVREKLDQIVKLASNFLYDSTGTPRW